MVKDRITDGKRIGQLLASELNGRESGPLGAVSVTNAEPDVTPTADGAFAFDVEADGVLVGTVSITPETARFELEGEVSGDSEIGDDRVDVTVEEHSENTVVVAHSGAAAKVVVDVVADRLR